MNKATLGIDIGSISTKGVVVDDSNQVLASAYLWTEGDPIQATKRVLHALSRQLPEDVAVVSVGTTGSARRLIGTITGATEVKNEITAHAVGTTTLYPDVRTIFEIGGQDSKVILVDGGVVVDYAMNTLCAAGTGAFLSSQAARLGVAVEDFGAIACASLHPTPIAARCTVFAESDLVHKAQIGYCKEDIIAGLCRAVVTNYLSNVCKGKKIRAPIVFQGGVSKNAGVVRFFEEATGEKVHVDPNGHLAGAFGVAVIARRRGTETPFSFALADAQFTTRGTQCTGCANNCEIIRVYAGDRLLDAWGNKCERGAQRID